MATVERLTERAVAVTFDVPDDLREIFAFEPGQHLTLRAEINGADVRRSYSICMSRAQAAVDGRLRIASNEVDGGAMSAWLNRVVRPGDQIDVLAPLGDFVCPPVDTERELVAVAAGSGITPVISLVRTILEEEPGSQVTLIFGNRTPETMMFREELHWLADNCAARFDLIEVFSRAPEAAADPLLTGRIDGEKVRQILRRAGVAVPEVDGWFLCGPIGMIDDVRTAIVADGADPATVQHEEFFQDPLPDA
ncbi:FAD-binding oxidoreductase [Flexivirga sp. B27]